MTEQDYVRFDPNVLRFTVTSHDRLSAVDLAPLSDELSKKYMFVSTNVSRFRPPAAGWLEVALSLAPFIAGAGAAKYAAAFLDTWASEDAKAIRARVLERIRDIKERHGMPPIPLELTIGRARFYFHEPVNDKEFIKRLNAAKQVVSQLPDEAFDNVPGPGEFGHVWDKSSQSWKGMVYGFHQGEFFNILDYIDLGSQREDKDQLKRK